MRVYVIRTLGFVLYFGICAFALAAEFREDFESGEIREQYWRKHSWNRGGEIELIKEAGVIPEGNNVVRLAVTQEDSGVALRFPPNGGIDFSDGQAIIEAWLKWDGTTEFGICFTDAAADEDQDPFQRPAFKFYIENDSRNEEGFFTVSTNVIRLIGEGFRVGVASGEWNHYAVIFELDPPDRLNCSVSINALQIGIVVLDISGMDPKGMFVYFQARRTLARVFIPQPLTVKKAPGSAGFADNGGSTFDEVSISGSFDTEPPSGTITILSLNNRSEYTNSTSVKLKLDARDAESGFGDVYISGDVAESKWEPLPPGRVVSVEWEWELSGENGLKEVSAEFRDAAGNTSSPVSDTITLDKTMPTVTLTRPSAGARLKGTVTLSANATDNIGIDRVKFIYGTTTIKEDTSSPYSISWNTNTVSDGDYQLAAVARDVAGNEVVSAWVTVTIENGDAVEPEDMMKVSWGGLKNGLYSFALEQNFPNPFNPGTWIPYRLAEDSQPSIRIYSAAGQLIRILNLGYRPAGIYAGKDSAAYWDGTTDTGERVSAGTYFYSIQAGSYSFIRKMIVIQ